MEEGSMRADVNVSVRKPGEEFGTRTETKNVNSVRFVMQVIEYEANRQVDVLESAARSIRKRACSMSPPAQRARCGARKTRMITATSPIPICCRWCWRMISSKNAAQVLPELPDAKRRRYETELGLTPYNARELTAEVETFARFETLLAATAKSIGKPETEVATQVANWALSVAPGVIKSLGDEADLWQRHRRAAGCDPCDAGQGRDQRRSGQGNLRNRARQGREPDEIADTEGLKQVSDTGAIEAAIDEILAANADKVEQYKGGKDKLFGFFVGQTMKAMQGKANPAVVNQLLKDESSSAKRSSTNQYRELARRFTRLTASSRSKPNR
jgi:aspartyl-tRNA(Asn)/glutamyl-tRNA(Gln) amidotransferase subunit B